MSTLKEDAEVLRYGLVAAVVPVAEVVAWADRVIASEAHPDPAVLELALSAKASPAEVVSLLAAVPGVARQVDVMRRFLGTLLEALDADPQRGEEFATFLVGLAGLDLPVGDFGAEPYGLGDAFALARSGTYGTVEEALADLRDYLERHAFPLAPGAR